MRRLAFKWLPTVGASLLAFAGCGEDPAREIPLAPEITLLPLESDVVFQVYEGYGAPDDPRPRYNVVGEPRVALRMRTAKEYPCSNYQIEYEKTISGNAVHIELLGRSIGTVCLTAIGPATAGLFLDLELGSYQLEFTDGSETARFVATVTDSAFSVMPETGTIARSEYAVYWRYPPESFAYYCGTTDATRWMCDEFVYRLTSIVRIEEFSFPESGRAPWPTASSGAHYNAPTRFFQYSEEPDFEAAGAALQTFANEVIGDQQGVTLSIWSWRNDRFLSWLHNEP